MIPWLTCRRPVSPLERALEEPNGLLAASDDLSCRGSSRHTEKASSRGIAKGSRCVWSPDPRMVLVPSELRTRDPQEAPGDARLRGRVTLRSGSDPRLQPRRRARTHLITEEMVAPIHPAAPGRSCTLGRDLDRGPARRRALRRRAWPDVYGDRCSRRAELPKSRSPTSCGSSGAGAAAYRLPDEDRAPRSFRRRARFPRGIYANARELV